MLTFCKNTDTELRRLIRLKKPLGKLYVRKTRDQWRVAMCLRFGSQILGQMYTNFPINTPEHRVHSARDLMVKIILDGMVENEEHFRVLRQGIQRHVRAKNEQEFLAGKEVA